MDESQSTFFEKEEHFASVKSCRKRINWETEEMRKLLNTNETNSARASELTFSAAESIGRPCSGTLHLHQDHVDTLGNPRMLRPWVRLEKSPGSKANGIGLSFSLEIYSGTQKIWDGKTDGQNKSIDGRILFEPVPFQLLAPSLENKDEKISVVFEIEVSFSWGNYYLAVPTPKEAATAKPTQTGERLRQDVSLVLLETGAGSDFVVKVLNSSNGGYYSRKVHKGVLALASPVFKAMVNFENDTMEGKESYTLIEDLSETGLNILLKYLYTGIISLDWTQVPLEILNAAEKYHLLELKEFCRKNLQESLKEMKPFDIDQLAELSRSPNPKKKLEELVSKAVDDIIHTFKLDSLIK